ncbi:unnamed protein product [Cyclocybe aegerita]|uniref:C2H2-type domain-containing protein n=1 Tax=Cyclocybe aegerita TaxID=1973307 RepID=A0A8S0WSC2_CYCAE|nr:unnamed protein product [Cyclocybe aegerita]
MNFVASLYSLSSNLNTSPQGVLDIFQETISVVSAQQPEVQHGLELDAMAFRRKRSRDETSISTRACHRLDSPLDRSSSTSINIYPSSTSFHVDEYLLPDSSTPSSTLSSPTFASESPSQLWLHPSVAAFNDYPLTSINHRHPRGSTTSPHAQADQILTPFEATLRRATGEFKTPVGHHPSNDFLLGLQWEDTISDHSAGLVQLPVGPVHDGSWDTPTILKDHLPGPGWNDHTAISWDVNDEGLLPPRFVPNGIDLHYSTSSGESYEVCSPYSTSSQPSSSTTSLARDSGETEQALPLILPNSQERSMNKSHKSGHHIQAGTVQLVYPPTWVSLAASLASSSPVIVTCRLLTNLPTQALAPGPSMFAAQIHECGALINTVEAFIAHMEAHIGKKRRKGGNSARFRCTWNGCRTTHQVFDEGGYHRHLEQHGLRWHCPHLNCDFAIGRRDCLLEHLKKVHSAEEKDALKRIKNRMVFARLYTGT